jgi:Ecdysteroid kinase-like family
VYCSPAADLTYAMGMVKRDEEGNMPTEELITFYHEEFVSALKSLGYMKTTPSRLDLNVELLKHGALNCLFWICLLPFTFIDWKNMSVEDMMSDDTDRAKDFKKRLFDHPVYKKLVCREMKEWKSKGWF